MGGLGMMYDTKNGTEHYAENHLGGIMDLTGYMTKTPLIKNLPKGIVNCYDQAAAVCSFGSLLGVEMKYKLMQPFGFVKAHDLVGVGNCNSPFYKDKRTNPIVLPNAYERTAFGTHAFAVSDGKVYDACFGPATGTQTEFQYVSDTIDVSRGFFGTTNNISLKAVRELK